MKFNYDFDTAPYFSTVASTLISRHGEDALALADQAIRTMRTKGDAEAIFMWEGVRSAIFDTIMDSMNAGEKNPDGQSADFADAVSSGLFH